MDMHNYPRTVDLLVRPDIGHAPMEPVTLLWAGAYLPKQRGGFGTRWGVGAAVGQ